MSDQDQALAIHNKARADAVTNHGSTCGPLVWDANLANDAQQWAQHMADTDTFEHSGVANEGENLFEATPDVSLAAATQGWCNEIAGYSGQNIPEGNFESYGHYTQVVWPTTTAVGMASARGGPNQRNVYVCARYSPAGNQDGKSAWGPGGNAGQGANGGGVNPKQHIDGAYLVNSFNGNQSSSGIAYYSNIRSRRQGQQPDAYIDVKNPGVVTWEGGDFQATFHDGNVFKVAVNAVAANAGQGVQVGGAENSSHSFNVFKADGSNIYTIDGWNVFAIYQCL